jgi:hypothetical protein
MCTVLLPPGVYPIAVKYIISKLSSNIPGTHFSRKLSRPQGGRNEYVNKKNPNESNGILSRGLPKCSTVPQPTATQRATFWESAIGIASRYGLNGPWIESSWGRNFPYLTRPALGHTQGSVPCVLSLFPEGKVTVVWCWQPTHFYQQRPVWEELCLYITPMSASHDTGRHLQLYICLLTPLVSSDYNSQLFSTHPLST